MQKLFRDTFITVVAIAILSLFVSYSTIMFLNTLFWGFWFAVFIVMAVLSLFEVHSGLSGALFYLIFGGIYCFLAWLFCGFIINLFY